MPTQAKSFVSLDDSFADALEALAEQAETWSIQGQERLRNAHKQVGQRHRAEAVKRVPVGPRPDGGTLKKSLFSNVFESPGKITTETGTNIKYAIFTEFGTNYIAKGNVKRIGDKPLVSDAEAITIWPAKNADRIDSSGKAHPAAIKETEKAMAGGATERMPWLRTAWWKIRPWALKQLYEAMEPPPKKR